MKPIRNSAKALIIRDGRLLCIRNVSYKNETYYLLPGGGQEFGETITAALERECMEELGMRVAIKTLRYVRDYIGRNHAFREIHEHTHQVEYMFICDLIDASETPQSRTPDTAQTGIEWLSLSDFKDALFFPQILKSLIKADGSLSGDVYLGDTN